MKHHIIDATGKLQINIKAREWCRLPYPKHPHGCPNYGNRDICPPRIKTIDKVFNLNMPHWLVAVEFDMGGQATAKKELDKISNEVCRLHAGTICNMCPEAMGVDMIVTGRRLGLPIQPKPKPESTIFRMSLVGYPKEDLSHCY